MSNMSYCRFRNTLHDLRDCEDAFLTALDTSENDLDEDRARTQLLKVAMNIVSLYAEQAGLDELAEAIAEAENHVPKSLNDLCDPDDDDAGDA
jgi:hypothetical protein